MPTNNTARLTTPRTGPVYPQAGSHEWGAFAGVAVEFDGYCNAEVIDPWSNRVLFVPDAADGCKISDTLRRIADAMDATDFEPEWEPDKV